MSIIVKNLSTNETFEVKYVIVSEDGRLVSRDACGCGKKYCKTIAEYLTATAFTEDGKAVEFSLNEGFECEAAPTKQRAARKPRKTRETSETPAETPAAMTDEEFVAFVASLVPMPSPKDKTVNENYKRVLAAGFRCDRKKRQYVHPSGHAIYVAYDAEHVARWTAVTSEDEGTPVNDAPAEAPVVEDVVVTESTNDEPVVVIPEPVDDAASADEPTDNIDTTAAAIAAALKGLKVSASQPAPIDEATVARIAAEAAREVFAKMAEEQPKAAKLVAKKAKAENGGTPEEIFCEDFDDILEDVANGFYPYLSGAAGCGKSHTAEQIAKRLGLEFYPQTTIQFAHDVRGYGDAAGRFVETAFFKAFADEAHGGRGGLYFQDEYDRSIPEAAIVLNTALANGYYDFPVVGRVYAHPNFRFMAAGNTRMKGGDSQYVGQPMDASSRDRVIEYEMSYDHRVEIRIANGDETLVAFMEDVRKAITSTNIEHVVSYRATKYAAEMQASGRSLEKILKRKVFATLERDEIAVIYGALNDTTSPWAKAMKNLF